MALAVQGMVEVVIVSRYSASDAKRQCRPPRSPVTLPAMHARVPVPRRGWLIGFWRQKPLGWPAERHFLQCAKLGSKQLINQLQALARVLGAFEQDGKLRQS